jgi:UDP-N-acetyl-2-amino-2-deoxyglucuronate dehydrogenase
MAMNFAITGVAGFVAPRHLRAIRDTGNRLVAAVDPHDSVGILDNFFDDVAFFREFERFDRHLEKLRRKGEQERVQYLSICSPNYLHDAHIRLALRVGANAICEKPLVLNPWNLDALAEMEKETGKGIWTILQLRLHPSIRALKERIDTEERAGRAKKADVTLTYVAPRGKWYLHSWKGETEKSGGLSTNIGIHFFDMLLWIFGGARSMKVHLSEQRRESGVLELERARVRWFLSIDREDLPGSAVSGPQTTFRSVNVDGQEVEFSEGFADLHTESYREILAGRGFGIGDARPAVELAHGIRNARAEASPESPHPHFLRIPR